MRNKNVWIIVGLLALIAVVLLFSTVFSHTPQLSQNAPTLTATDAPLTITSPTGETLTPTAEASAEVAASPEPTAAPAPTSAIMTTVEPPVKAYLLVTVRGTVYQPVPLTEEGDYRVTQTDGSENVIHVSPTSAEMKSSTCENQDCVKQGVITLDNMETRVLGNMVICLPNQVTLELYTPEGIHGLFVQPSQEP